MVCLWLLVSDGDLSSQSDAQMITVCNGEIQTSKEKPFLIFYLPTPCPSLQKPAPCSPIQKEKSNSKKSKLKLCVLLSLKCCWVFPLIYKRRTAFILQFGNWAPVWEKCITSKGVGGLCWLALFTCKQEGLVIRIIIWSEISDFQSSQTLKKTTKIVASLKQKLCLPQIGSTGWVME